MVMNIIFSVLFLMILLVVFFVLRNETKPKKNLVLGVTIPHDKREDPTVAAVVKRFLVMEDILLVTLTLLLLPPFLLHSMAVGMTWYFVWIIFGIALPVLPYGVCNSRLRALKRKNGWFSESTGVTLVDTKTAIQPKKQLSIWVFIPAFVLSLVPVVSSLLELRGQEELWPMLLTYGIFALMNTLFYFLYRLINRQRAEVVDGNTAMNSALTQIRRHNWNIAWVWIVWLTTAFDLILWLARDNAAVIILLSIVYTALLLIAVLRTEFKTRRLQQKLTEESGHDVYTDDDDKWLFGIFYFNRNDSHNLVNRRLGIGTTVNMAKAPGKVLVILSGVLLLAMPLLGVWLMHEEAVSVSLRLEGTSLVAAHTGTVYTIDTGSILSASEIILLPSGTRTNGTAMDSVLKGDFKYNGIGRCRVCLDPRTPPFILVKTAEHTYLLGSSDADETLGVYKKLAGSAANEKDTAVTLAEGVIDSITAHDYQTVYNMMAPDMQRALPVDRLKQTFDPLLNASGKFTEYTGSQTTPVTQNGVDNITAVISAKYQRITRVFTISFAIGDMKLTGLYVK